MFDLAKISLGKVAAICEDTRHQLLFKIGFLKLEKDLQKILISAGLVNHSI